MFFEKTNINKINGKGLHPYGTKRMILNEKN